MSVCVNWSVVLIKCGTGQKQKSHQTHSTHTIWKIQAKVLQGTKGTNQILSQPERWSVCRKKKQALFIWSFHLFILCCALGIFGLSCLHFPTFRYVTHLILVRIFFKDNLNITVIFGKISPTWYCFSLPSQRSRYQHGSWCCLVLFCWRLLSLYYFIHSFLLIVFCLLQSSLSMMGSLCVRYSCCDSLATWHWWTSSNFKPLLVFSLVHSPTSFVPHICEQPMILIS